MTDQPRRTHRARIAIMLLLTLASECAFADPVAAINDARATTCVRSRPIRPLRESQSLDAAARRLAQGSSLHDVLGRLPARPTFAASLHFAGVMTDAQLSRAAASRFCRDLSNPDLQEIGFARVNNSLWIIVTAPFVAPAPGDDASIEAEILERINDARTHAHRCGATSNPAAPALRLSAALSRVARAHSQEMARADELAHEGRDGSTPADRVRRAGYAAMRVGENVAAGVPTAREVVTGWLASPGHCTNIMDRHFTEMGVAYATEPRSHEVIYWTQLFAEPR
jgi:uncharacterized protein YkwD